MHVLFIIPYTPNRIRTRSYNLIRYFAQLGHNVSLCTLWEDDGEREDLTNLASLGIRTVALPQSKARSLWNCLQALPTQTPLQAIYSWNPELAKQAANLLECNGKPAVDAPHVSQMHWISLMAWLVSLRYARLGGTLMASNNGSLPTLK